jgi:hypothetical protein
MPASNANGQIMAMLKANSAGAVQQLPPVTLNRSRERSILETITFAAQAAGAKIAVARVPIGAALTSITLMSDTASAVTFQAGDFNNAAAYSAAVAIAAPNAKQDILGMPGFGSIIVIGYDSDSGRTDLGYEDIILTTAGGALPAAGTLRVRTGFVLD